MILRPDRGGCGCRPARARQGCVGKGGLEADEAGVRLLPAPEPPPWRIGALAVTNVIGVAVADLASLVGVVSLERVLFPQADAAGLTHGVSRRVP
jgi:hypothetical protein